MKKVWGLVSCLSLLAACSEIPSTAYYNRGEPESLLDASSEVVSMSLASRSSLIQIEDMIAQDPPSRVELSCARGDKLCGDAKTLFDRYAIPVDFVGKGSGATLIYQRVLARDCENRYIDNSINPYNLSHPTFGCSVAANMVQAVSDKRQFVSPSLLDLQDGAKAAQTYGNYARPAKQTEGETPWVLRATSNSPNATGAFK